MSVSASSNIPVFAFVGGVGLAILALAAFLIVNGKIPGDVFNVLAGGLMGGVIGLLAPSSVMTRGAAVVTPVPPAGGV